MLATASPDGESIVEHITGIEDYQVALAAFAPRARLVTSLNRPGANVTGVSFLVGTIAAKRLELLHELVPTATVIGYLVDPDNPNSVRETRDIEAAARALGLQLHSVDARGEHDFASAFANFVQHRVDAVIVAGDPTFISRRDQVVALAAQHAIPAMYNLRPWAIVPSQILNGAKPADLPVIQSIRFELWINLKTAKTLGLAVPETLLARADEVIE